MKIHVLGAAGEVTGSAYLVETSRSRVLVDAGMFQGGAEADQKNALSPGLDPEGLDAVILTHAHLDHTGRVPILIKRGYVGPIYATAATFDLAMIILHDSAKLQGHDVVRANRKRQRADEPLLEPLYESSHVEPILRLAHPVKLNTPIPLADGIQGRFLEAGHILGSTSLELTIEDQGRRTVVVFSGDIGPLTMPILREPAPPTRADIVFLESTYGDRDHRPYPETVAEFTRIVRELSATGGKILIPTFAIGRSQQILYHLAVMFAEGAVKPFPVFLDSPMAIEATRVYRQHPELFDDEMRNLARSGVDPLAKDHFMPTVTADESRRLNDFEGSCLILAGAGMCTGGRILHHLRENLWRPSTHVVVVGFQAHGSLGRLLVDGARFVTLFGEKIAVHAKIHTLGGFSAHAGQGNLLKWFGALAGSRPRVVLTHGEDGPRATLAGLIKERFDLPCILPSLGEQIALT